jgi:hypothetical protein
MFVVLRTFSYNRNIWTLKLFSAIEVASGERGNNTEMLVARFSNQISDPLEHQQDGNNEESRWY